MKYPPYIYTIEKLTIMKITEITYSECRTYGSAVIDGLYSIDFELSIQWDGLAYIQWFEVLDEDGDLRNSKAPKAVITFIENVISHAI